MIFDGGRNAWGFTPEERRGYWVSDLVVVVVLALAVVIFCSVLW